MTTVGHSRQFSWVDLPDRKRRRVHISEPDSYDGPKDILSTLQHTYELDRIGVPPVKLLPLESQELDSDDPVWRKFYQTPNLQQDIGKTIEKYNIKVDQKDLVIRYDGFEPTPENSVTTFYIQIKQDSTANPGNQRAFVGDLYHLLRDGYDFKNDYAVTIELIGHRLWAPREICQLEFDHPFFLTWQDRLEREFLRAIKNDSPELVGKWRSMDVVRLGFDTENPSKNPVTVSITVDWSADPPAWSNAHKKMLDLIKSERFNYNVEVEFERGEIFMIGDYSYGPETRWITSAQANVGGIRPGCSISGGTAESPADPLRSMGTIGVVMEVVEKNTPSQKLICTVVLTNYHVVRSNLQGFQLPDEKERNGKWPEPVPDSICAYMDTTRYFEPKEKNSARGQRVSPIIFRSPSFREIEVSKEHAKEKLVEQQQRMINIPKGLGNTMAIQEAIQVDIIKAQKYLELLQRIRVDQLGSIYYSGGLSRKHPTGLGRLDVAAILLSGDVANKACNDFTHRETEWPSKCPNPSTNSITQLDNEFGKVVNNETPKKEGRVYKIGAKSGCTTGHVNGKKVHTVNLPWHKEGDYSSEVAVIGEWNDWFSWMGDSGPGVFNVYGQLLGLLYAGQTKYNSHRPLTYVIPAHTIKDDFEEATGGKYTLRVKQ